MSPKHFCTHCQRPGHKDNRCWRLHPDRLPGYMNRDRGEHLKNARKLRQSGKAYRYKPKKTGFLDLPFEIRSLVLQGCLSNGNAKSSFPDQLISLNDNEYDIAIEWSHPRSTKVAEISSLNARLDTEWPSQMWVGRHFASVSGFSILLTCRTLAAEGISILYEKNHFFTLQPLRFLIKFRGIVGANFQCLRHLTIGLPSELKLNTLHLPVFLDLFCDSLLDLRFLCLTVSYPWYGRPLDEIWAEEEGIDRAAQEERALMHTAAWITLRHPNLCEAIWVTEREERYPCGEDDLWHQEWEGAPLVMEVKLATAMFKQRVCGEISIGLENWWKGPPFDPEYDCVLNCRNIRAAGWTGWMSLPWHKHVKTDFNEPDEPLDTLGWLRERFAFLSVKKKRVLGLPMTRNG